MSSTISYMFKLLLLTICCIYADDTLNVDIESSQLNWIGKKVTGEHSGNISLSNGWVIINNGIPVNGFFEIDMTTITTTDIESPEWSLKLNNHLKDNDFFAVDSFPNASLKLLSSTIDKNNSLLIHSTADLTIRGITNSIVIPFKLNKNKMIFSAKGSVDIDRTMYNVKYKSDKFFEGLGDNMIYDNFTITFNLLKKQSI